MTARDQLAVPTLKTRRPTGRPAWPRILLSGEEGAHKSTEAAKLSIDPRIGTMYWLEVGAGENTADEYGALDGVTYEIIDHDGTWLDIYGQLCAAWDVAKAAESREEPPSVLAVDAAHGVYGMLLEWGDTLARRRLEKQIQRDNRDRRDPSVAWNLDTEAQKQPDIWNSINRRWGQFMAKVLTWPGPAILIAGEKLVTPFVNGQPDPRAPKEWTMDGAPKTLPRQCTAWVRMTRERDPQVVKLRSAKEANAIPEGGSVFRSNFTCSTLIFDWVGCETGVSRAPVHRELDADQVMPGEGATEQGQQGTRSPVRRAAAAPDRPVLGLLDAEKQETFDWWVSKVEQNGDGVLDATGHLTDDDRDVLGLGPDDAVTLDDLCALIGGYRAKHGHGPRQDEPVAAAG